MSDADELIHQSLRLKVMAALHAEAEPLEFTRLKRLVQATDGNLGGHVTTLEKAGYVSVKKDFADRKPRTRVAITKAGRQAFRNHVAYLKTLVDGLTED